MYCVGQDFIKISNNIVHHVTCQPKDSMSKLRNATCHVVYCYSPVNVAYEFKKGRMLHVGFRVKGPHMHLSSV